LSPLTQGVLRLAQHPQGWQVFDGSPPDIGFKGGLQRCIDELTDPDGPHEVVAAHSPNHLCLTHNQPALRASQELVTAKGHNIGALPDAILNHRLISQVVIDLLRQAYENTTTKIIKNRYAPLAPKGDQLVQGHLVSEPCNPVVAGMNPHQKGRVLGNGLLIVLNEGTVGGSHLNELGTAFGHNPR